MSINLINEFNVSQNRKVWEEFHKYIASTLMSNDIPLDNVFFVNTPAFVVCLSDYDNSIIQRPASDYSLFITRRVIVEKIKESKKFNHFYSREPISGERMLTRNMSVASYRLNWNESVYGSGYDVMKSLKKFIKSKSHLALFLYVDSDFLQTIQSTKIIRVATLDTTSI